MIKKKRKYKKRKRNSDNLTNKFYHHLAVAIKYGDPVELSFAKVIYSQGEECDDCGKDYLQCDCEYCSDCGFPRCLCDLNITIHNWLDSNISNKKLKEYQNKTKKLAIEYANSILTNQQLFELDKYINKV